jgi:hypothetical protein
MRKKSKPNNPKEFKCLLSKKQYRTQFIEKRMDTTEDDEETAEVNDEEQVEEDTANDDNQGDSE